MVEKSVISYGGVQMGLLEKGISWISLFIALAPMLGFMGTVIGPNAWSHAGEYFGPEPGDFPADINNDGVVDGGDLGILLAQWSCAGSCTADVNADGLVDGSDLGAILASWEYCGG